MSVPVGEKKESKAEYLDTTIRLIQNRNLKREV